MPAATAGIRAQYDRACRSREHDPDGARSPADLDDWPSEAAVFRAIRRPPVVGFGVAKQSYFPLARLAARLGNGLRRTLRQMSLMKVLTLGTRAISAARGVIAAAAATTRPFAWLTYDLS